MNKKLIGISAILAASLLSSHAATITNGSFETGDFTGWTTSAVDFNSVFPISVQPAGFDPNFGFVTATPTDGNFVAASPFDGSGPETITIAQDIGVLDASSGNLTFTYRGAWDLVDFGASINRQFNVVVEPAGGGAPLATFNILTANVGENILDTGAQTASIDLSAFLGSNVRISFEMTVPENLTGPAYMQIDSVALGAVPEASSALFGASALGLLAFRRRR